MRAAPLAVSLVAAGLAGLIALAPDADAQTRTAANPFATGTAFEFTPYAGYMMFGDMFSGPLGTSVSAAPAPVVGAQLGMKLAPHLSLVGNLATASSDVKAGVAFLGGVTVGHTNVVMYDAGLQLDVPAELLAGGAVSPFLQAGLGGMRYTVTESLLTLQASNLAGNVGAGADVALGRGVGVRVMAKDYIGKFDFAGATTFDIPASTTNNVAVSVGLRLSF